MSQTQSTRGRGAPAASTATRGVILVVGAVIIGAMLLWKGGGAEKATVSGENILKPGSPAGKVTTTTAAPPVTTALPPAQLLVVVANGSGTAGLAKTKATALKAKGYSAATFVAGTVTPLTQVFFVAGFEGDAQAVAAALTLPAARVAPIPDPAPIAKLGDNKVVIVVGQDKGDAAVAGAAAPTTTKKP